MKPVKRNSGLWILNSWQDLGLFVLSPLWIIPLLWLAISRFDPNGFGAVLLAIGGTGHHLPGFIRAYTDPILFRRFRTRFILAPLFLLAIYVLFFSLRLEGLKLILVLWGTWHGAMQVNGFLRIYDSKVGSFSPVTAWLDWAMCLVWFGGGLLYSSRLIVVFSHFFRAGGTEISSDAFSLFRHAWMVVAGAILAAFLINAWKQARAGKPASPVKLLMMVSSFALWWFAMVGLNSLLVGLLLFEIVHDIQYNALVWIYNRRRVAQGMTASRVETFLFQPNLSRALFYLFLIAAYGGLADLLDYANVQAPDVLQIGPSAASFWTGLFMVSTFLHFYFDGFIWQVREDGFRKGMGMGTESATPITQPLLAGGWKWAFFVIPVVVLGVSEYRSSGMPLVNQARNMVELMPDHWQANAVAGTLEKAGGNYDDALGHLQKAVALNPAYSYGEAMLADIYSGRGESEPAVEHYVKAVDLNPTNYDVRWRLGKVLVNAGRDAEAVPHLRLAADHGPANAEADYFLGALLVREQKPAEGIPYLNRAIQRDSRNKLAFNYLGVALELQGDFRAASAFYTKALEIDPGFALATENLGRVRRALASTSTPPQ